MELNIDLPDPANGYNPITIKAVKSLVLVGANGSGKSRLGAWIEENTSRSILVHRVSAQRAIHIPTNTVSGLPVDTAERMLLYGSENGNQQSKFQNRWNGRPVIGMLSDIERLMVLLFSRQNKRNTDHSDEVDARKEYLERPLSPIDKIQRIWNLVFEHRELKFDVENGRVLTQFSDNALYPASDMSDGERVAFYLMGQCLCVPPNTILIIDEPEIHLHKSILDKLWNTLETERSDCLFVYITHDLDFAASRQSATKIWVKGFDGTIWDWEELESLEDVPDEMLFKITGSRKNIILIEGDEGSPDYRIFDLLYSEFTVVPGGGCNDVIKATQSLRKHAKLHHLKIYALIDRDYRNAKELETLEKGGIYCLEVAEFENLFWTKEILAAFNNVSVKLPLEEIYRNAESIIFRELNNDLVTQVLKMTINQIQDYLTRFSSKGIENVEALKGKLQAHYIELDTDKINNDHSAILDSVVEDKDYEMALKLFNNKDVLNKIASEIFNRKTGKAYINDVITLASSEDGQPFLDGFRKYIPDFSSKTY